MRFSTPILGSSELINSPFLRVQPPYLVIYPWELRDPQGLSWGKARGVRETRREERHEQPPEQHPGAGISWESMIYNRASLCPAEQPTWSRHEMRWNERIASVDIWRVLFNWNLPARVPNSRMCHGCQGQTWITQIGRWSWTVINPWIMLPAHCFGHPIQGRPCHVSSHVWRHHIWPSH